MRTPAALRILVRLCFLSRVTDQRPTTPSQLFDREQLERLQRARVLDAVVAVVAERGYLEASVADVVARGGLSRRTFYELFDSKADAFFAAYEAVLARAVRRIEVACLDHDDPERRVLAGLAELLRLIERHPSWARVCIVEAPAASAVAGDRARHLRPAAAWVEEVRRVLALDTRLDPLAHVGMVLGGLQASMIAPERDAQAALLDGLFRLTVGRDSPDVGLPTALDGDPMRVARLVATLRPPVDLAAATDGIVDAIVDHDHAALAAADDAIGRLLARAGTAAAAPRVELLLLRHVVRVALESGPAGVLAAIGYSRTGEAANVTALRCLYHLAEHPGATGGELRRVLGVGPSALSRLLGILRDRGEVRGEGSAGRQKRWELTAAGRRRLVFPD